MIKNLAIGGSNRTLLFLALLMGLTCAALVGVYLSSLDTNGGTSGSSPSVPVVVATVEIPAQTTITQNMVTVTDVPGDLALAGVFSEAATVVGKKTQVAIVPGQQILATNATDAVLAQEVYGLDAPLSLVIPEGQRAFSIYISQIAAVGGLARSGDYVDILMSGVSAPAADGAQTATACYVTQNMQVLAVGSTVKRAGTENDTSGIAAVDPNPDANTMTLAATPEQAGQLAAAQRSVAESNVGNPLWVMLRQFGDHGVATGLPQCTLTLGS